MSVMQFGILGPTEVWAPAGTPISVGGSRPRTLLALLLLDAGQVVGTTRLIDDVYGENPPKEAVNALQSLVSRLRRKLGPGLIEFHPGGYRLRVDPEQVDAHRFTRLARAGRQALAADRPGPAAELLTEALGLWRGRPELPGPRVAKLDELYTSAREDRAEAELARGGETRELLTELHELVAAHPLRERPRALLMRALQASGRHAEALTVFDDTRRTLADELGADPSPELAETHLAILAAEPLRTTGIPAQLTNFIGRAEELRRVHELLATARLVTVTGPGGMGKTRLAIQAGAAGGAPEACFVDLAPLTDGTELPQAIFTALGLRETGLFHAPHDRPDPVEKMITALANRPLLLIVDNCEHIVAEAAVLIHRLLTACPSLRVLATSREPLGITGEALCPLPPLPEDLAVDLFADRARAVLPGFTPDDAVRRICRALDGLPLAIELAAARLRSLSPAQLETRLTDRFRLLSRGARTAAPRHQTLHAVVNWSWDLLDGQEQRLLRRLSVFAGGATAEAAAQVLSEVDAEELLEALADKSLVEVSCGRYRMLDTIREFSAQRLAEAGEHDRFARAHAEYFLDLAQTADPHLRRAEQVTWLARLSAEHANLHAALRWAAHADQPTAFRLIGALTTYWRLRGVHSEVAPLAAKLTDRLEPLPGLEEEFVLAVLTALPDQPEGALEQAGTIMRTKSWRVRQPYLLIGWSLFTGPPDPDTPAAPVYAHLADTNDPWFQALILFSGSYLRVFSGDRNGAETELSRALAAFRSVGDRWGIAQALDGLATLADDAGDRRRALTLTEDAMRELAPLGAADEIAEFCCRRASLLLREGDLDAAESGYRQAERLLHRSWIPTTLAMVHHGYGQIAERHGDHAEARRRFQLALAACGPDWQSLSLRAQVLVSLALLDQDGARAARLLGVAESVGNVVRDRDLVARIQSLVGEAAYDTAFRWGAAMSREEAVEFVRSA
ncbi:BTAD domain-containing putative transcriptional regulator [Amycolatopsis taiwanensis]|uniref:BTAD domain-containing putative transcriptional regulator n=1 Tax=Amycolatopsis taiwanensis TaxID=342230 RepID=UPI000693BB57|nr:BTAD domain-containing putative transcriptional regulator [Amycolatopsis taiwanensis]